MKKVNEYFEVSDDAEYVLVHDTWLRITNGRAVAHSGGLAEAKSGGRAVANSGGRAEAKSGGRAVAHSGGLAVAYSGGRAEAYSGGRAVAYSGGRAVAKHEDGIAYTVADLPIIARDEPYELRMTPDGLYMAGCRGPWTAAEALKHWDCDARDDDRALLFTLAIGMMEHAK